MAFVDRLDAAGIQNGRFVLDGRSYGFCADPVSFELIDAAPRGIAYGFIAERNASPVVIEAAAGPATFPPRTAQDYVATARLLGGGTFFVRALPASACAYRGAALAPAPIHGAGTTAAQLYLFNVGRCQSGQLVQPRQSGRSVPAATPPSGLSPQVRQQFLRGRALIGQTGCLACHQIGSQGNSGPGARLDAIGRKLTQPALSNALLHSPAPMPSFAGVSSRDRQAIVVFLAHLR